jgi:hypothetical protein
LAENIFVGAQVYFLSEVVIPDLGNISGNCLQGTDDICPYQQIGFVCQQDQDFLDQAGFGFSDFAP